MMRGFAGISAGEKSDAVSIVEYQKSGIVLRSKSHHRRQLRVIRALLPYLSRVGFSTDRVDNNDRKKIAGQEQIPSDVGDPPARERHDPKAIVFAIDALLHDLLRR